MQILKGPTRGGRAETEPCRLHCLLHTRVLNLRSRVVSYYCFSHRPLLFIASSVLPSIAAFWNWKGKITRETTLKRIREENNYPQTSKFPLIFQCRCLSMMFKKPTLTYHQLAVECRKLTFVGLSSFICEVRRTYASRASFCRFNGILYVKCLEHGCVIINDSHH